MKHIFTLDIKTYSSLKVKRGTLVITNCEASSNSKEKIKEDDQASSHPVINREDLQADNEPTKAREISENVEGFQYGPTNGKFLKYYFP